MQMTATAAAGCLAFAPPRVPAAQIACVPHARAVTTYADARDIEGSKRPLNGFRILGIQE